MQQHDQSGRHKTEVDALLTQLGHILERLAVIGPQQTVTVPLALPVELAEMMVGQAETLGLDLADVYVSTLLHGGYHSALENGLPQGAQQMAQMIRAASTPDVWERFVQQHPQTQGPPHDRARGGGP